VRAIRFLVRIFFVVVAFVLLTVGLVWAFGDGPSAPVAKVSELRAQGFLHLEDLEIYLVWDEGEIHAVSDNFPTPLGRSANVFYCEKGGLFETELGPYDSSKFDRSGRYYGGSAPRGLTTYDVRTENGEIFVDLQHPNPPLPRGSGADEPIGPFCSPV
jgi:hypothetical protein